MKKGLILSQLLLALTLGPLAWYGPVLFGNEKAHHQSIASFAGVKLESSRFMTDVSRTPAGKLVSNKPPGFPLLMMPAFLLIRSMEALNLAPPSEDLEFRLLKVFALLFSGMVFFLMVLLGTEHAGFSFRTSYLVGFTTVYATLIFPYSTLLVAHVPSAVLVLAAYYFGLEHNRSPNSRKAFWGMLCASFSCVVDYANLFAIIPSVVLLTRQSFRAGTLIPCLAGAVFPGLMLLSYNLLVFGKLFTVSYSSLQPPSYVAWPGVIGSFANNPLPTFVSFLFSKSRGIFVLHPVLLLSIPGIWLSHRKGFSVTSQMAFVSFLSAVFFLSFYLYWHGGNSVGSRHILTAIPFLCLFLGFAMENGRWMRVGYAVFLVISMLTALLAYWIQVDDVAIHLTWLHEPQNIHGSFYELLAPVALSGNGVNSPVSFSFLAIYLFVIIPALHLAVYRFYLVPSTGTKRNSA